MDTDPIELIDLGAATEETRQWFYMPVFPDSGFVLGMVPDLG